MKKLFTFFLFAICACMPLRADNSQQEKMIEAVKQRLILIAKTPLNAHWIQIQSKIMELLREISLQLNAENIVITFDQRAFDALVFEVAMKLSMPSVTDSERHELRESLEEYLGEKGQLARVYNALQLSAEKQDSQVAREAIQHIQNKLEQMNVKVEATRKEK